jgi:hypothetical protein
MPAVTGDGWRREGNRRYDKAQRAWESEEKARSGECHVFGDGWAYGINGDMRA